MGVVSYFLVVAANLAITGGTLGAVNALGGTVAAWRTVVTIFGVAGAALLLLCAGTVKELPMEETGEQAKEQLAVKEGFRIVAKNPYYFWCIIVNIVMAVALAALSNLTLYYCKINLHDLDLYSVLNGVGILFMIPGLLIAPTLVAKLGAWKCNVYTSVFVLVVTIMCIPASMLSGGVPFMVLYLVRNIPCGVLAASLAPIGPGVAEYSYLQSGHHVEGMIFSSSSIGFKIGSGISAGMVGWVLGAIHYDYTAEIQSAATEMGMALAFFGIPIVMFAVCILAFYNLNVEKGLEKLQKQLEGEMNNEDRQNQ